VSKTGNHCGHNPKKPKLSPEQPIRRGKDAPPRILSLAAARTKPWYKHPAQCPQLTRSELRADKTRSPRRVRSERREAWQVVLETILSLMDLSSRCLSQPMPGGPIYADMRTIAAKSGLSKRRCERAMRDLTQAGFIDSHERCGRNDLGDYYGLRAIRQVKDNFFIMVRLLGMLRTESARTFDEWRKKAAKLGLPVSQFFTHVGQAVGRALKRKSNEKMARRWNQEAAKPQYEHLPYEEACRRINAALGYPEGYAPGSV
jgi:hypothetical protein